MVYSLFSKKRSWSPVLLRKLESRDFESIGARKSPLRLLDFAAIFLFLKKEDQLDNEKAKTIKGIIAEVVGFDTEDINEEDKFIVDYKITYGERKALLEKLNITFRKEFGFDEFCKMDKVADVIDAYTASSVGQPD